MKGMQNYWCVLFSQDLYSFRGNWIEMNKISGKMTSLVWQTPCENPLAFSLSFNENSKETPQFSNRKTSAVSENFVTFTHY